MDHQGGQELGSGRPVRGFGVATVLFLVALIPLAGAARVSWGSIVDARAVTHAAARTEDLARQAVDLAELDAAVFDEMVAHAMGSVFVSLGVPVNVLSAAMGYDPIAQLAALEARTDELLGRVGRADVTDAVASARMAGPEVRVVVAAFGSVTAAIESPLATLLAELRTARSDAIDADRLVGAVRILEVAVDARAAMAQEFATYFSVVFDLRDAPAEELARLIELQVRYSDGVAELRALETSTPELHAALDALAADSSIRQFAAATDVLVARSLADGLPATGLPLTLDTVAQRNSGFTAAFKAMIGSSATTLALVDAAGDAVLTAARSVRSDADDDIRGAYTLALGLTLASLLAAVLAARYIVRPLRSLERAARDLQTDHEKARTRPVGPTEVKAAAHAIRDAATHFDLVTRQARALATGDLDASALDETAPGGLGAALQHAVGTLRSALAQQDEFRRRLAHEATHDGLTKLPNRNASMAQLARSLARTTRSGSQLAVLFIDLDRFKDVNDHHGHQAGDTVLTTVAQRLVNHVREGDHVGRLGGDEFVVIAEPVSGLDETVRLAERIIATLTEPVELPTGPITTGASIGIALSDGTSLTADELLRDADLAVYRAKAAGRGGIEICDEELRNEHAETADLSVAIRHAIDRDELTMYYQPIVDTHTGELRAFEALVRWRRPGHERLVPPDLFIGFAERSSLIIDVDRWVLDAVARQAATWRQDPRYDGVPVAINVSGRHLSHDGFVEHVLEPLGRHGVDPHAIIIEVTESALLDDLASAAVKLQRLRDAGVRISIDDFGTGYTSLSHLRSLPVDILKIDRSFTQNATVDPHEASIVKLIIDTGHLLGATITAEGVETASEAETLAGLGSDHLQGYYFARPQPPELLASEAAVHVPASR
jgi:diguanylate cyclase (GGDEF)-like protein